MRRLPYAKRVAESGDPNGHLPRGDSGLSSSLDAKFKRFVGSRTAAFEGTSTHPYQGFAADSRGE
jgi:hypothetical protein